MIDTELGTLRRSHYSTDITSAMDGESATIMGWVLTIRGHGNISFGTIRDKFGDISVIAKKGDCSDEIREKISSLKPHSSIGVIGKVKSSDKAPNGFEIIPLELCLHNYFHAVFGLFCWFCLIVHLIQVIMMMFS